MIDQKSSTKKRYVFMTVAASAVLMTLVTSATISGNKNKDQSQSGVESMRATTELNADTRKEEHVKTQPGASVEASIHTSNSKKGNTKVEVNNQPIDVPKNGTVHKVFKSKDGKTEVNISSNSTSSGNDDTSMITDFNINTSTHSYQSRSDDSS